MRRAFLAYPLLEVLATWGLASLIGWGWTLLALLACIPVGFAIMRSAGEDAFADLQQAGRAGLPPGQGSRHALRFAAGLLIAVPGPLTTIAGLLLVTGPGQALARRIIGRRFTMFTGGLRGGDVVVGDVVVGDVVVGDVVVGDVVTGDVVESEVVEDPDMRQGPSRHPELGP